MSWALYRDGLISARALRVYFAAHEMSARRCEAVSGRTPRYAVAELAELTGGVGEKHVRAALGELARVGLLELSSSALRFATRVEDLRERPSSAALMLEEFKKGTRAVPVPRRVVRLLASRAGRGTVATTLAHVLRCMRFIRGRGCVSSGLVHPRWIAQVFGVSLAAVKASRAALTEEGLFECAETPRWVRRRWGSRITVNPTWGSSTEVSSRPKSSSIPSALGSKSGFSDSQLEPSTTFVHQKPARRGPAGFFGQNPEGPTLRNVRLEDLGDVRRLEVLFREAAGGGLVRDGESGFRDFVALAERAKRIGRDPCAVFATLLRKKRWDFIANADEDQALRRLSAFRNPRRQEPVRSTYADPEAARKAELRRQLEQLLRTEPVAKAS